MVEIRRKKAILIIILTLIFGVVNAQEFNIEEHWKVKRLSALKL